MLASTETNPDLRFPLHATSTSMSMPGELTDLRFRIVGGREHPLTTHDPKRRLRQHMYGVASSPVLFADARDECSGARLLFSGATRLILS